MLSKIRELREARVAKHARCAEILKKHQMTPEDRAEFDGLMGEMEAMKGDIDRMERADATEAELRATQRPPEAPVGAAAKAAMTAEERERKHREAFRDYLINGLNPDDRFPGVSEEHRAILREYRDMGTGGGNALAGTGGGYFVPVGFVNRVEEAMKYFGNMLAVSTIMDTATGQPLPYPTSNDTSVTGELVGEGASVTTADVTLGNIVLNAYKFSTKMVKVSIELLQDSAFDVESFLSDQFGRRLGRILNTKFTVGLGTTEPTGIITAATASGQTVVGDDNATSPDPATEVGYIDLTNLEHTLDIAYRPGAKFMFHDTTLRFIKGLKDKYGRPLWLPGVAVNAPDTILGYPYSINNDMETLAAGKKTVAFGQLNKYLIRRVKELAVLRLVERFADYGQVAFLGFARYDGNLLDAGTHPVVYLTQYS